MLDFLWDLGQEGRLQHQERQLQNATQKAKDAQTATADLELKVARLTLLCEALWEIVKTDGRRKDSDLTQIMTDLDLSDGKRDGRHSPSIKCDRCGKTYQKGRMRCIFCGASNPNISAFRKI